MNAVTEFAAMAKKKGRVPTSTRKDTTVKVDSGIVERAKMIAKARDVSLAEYLSDLLRTPVNRDFAAEMKRMAGE